jgi:hypothetical protein
MFEMDVFERHLPFILIQYAMAFSCAPWGAASTDGHSLFFIENNQSKKYVQYDVHPVEEGNPPNEPPVVAYWILQNGETKELSAIQGMLAYGIESQKRLGDGLSEIVLTAFKKRKITIRKTYHGYKAFAKIDGRECILERIYIEPEEGVIGPPKVIFVDIFGRDTQTNLPTTERLLPESRRRRDFFSASPGIDEQKTFPSLRGAGTLKWVQAPASSQEAKTQETLALILG